MTNDLQVAGRRQAFSAGNLYGVAFESGINDRIHDVAEQYLSAYIESRFVAVNVMDVELSEATKRHFVDRGQGSFWTMYQQIKK